MRRRDPQRGDRPRGLADRLFSWELSSDWEVFHGAAATYADVLGEAGLARYRALAEPLWAELPTRGPGDATDRLDHGRRLRITTMMEALARDLDELIAVRSKDLSSSSQFLRIAEACRKAGLTIARWSGPSAGSRHSGRAARQPQALPRRSRAR